MNEATILMGVWHLRARRSRPASEGGAAGCGLGGRDEVERRGLTRTLKYPGDFMRKWGGADQGTGAAKEPVIGAKSNFGGVGRTNDKTPSRRGLCLARPPQV